MAKTSRRVRHPIVCGTDFTPQAHAAATVAARLAVALRHPLLLVHAQLAGGKQVRTGAGGKHGANGALRREAARLRALGATVATELHRGHADEVLVARASETGAVLIVVGALGTRAPTRRFLGSIAERTAELAPAPTLVVRQAAALEQWLRGKRPLRVFLGFDFTVTAEAAADWVREIRTAGPCEVTVGHLNWPPGDERRFGVLDRPPASGNSPRVHALLTQQVADRVDATLGDEQVELRVEPLTGRADLALVAMAAAARADLVVVGTHQRHGLARLWSGSVSRGVLSEAPVAVAVVPVVATSSRERPIPKVRRVLVATDLWGQSQRVVAYACGIVRPGGVVRIVQVTHPRAISGGAFETTLGRTDRHLAHVRALSRRLEALRPGAAQDLGLDTEAAVVDCEDAVTGICQEAERFDADVVVVGTKGAGLTRAILGSVAGGVVARLRRPVLVVNPVKD
ncbi:MAG: universal stress protein [Acidobacteriota bacterium]|nr:universal stress protein [Acidobacteriota bacterium]